MAKDYKLITAILTIVIRCLFAYQRKMAKRAGHRGAKPAAVTFIQRWGRVMNSHLHFHVLLPDGVFVLDEKGDSLQLIPLLPPTDEEIVALVKKIAKKVTAFCQNHFATVEDMESGVLDGAILEAMRKLPIVPISDESHEDEEPDGALPKLKRSKRCAAVDGFTVHANTVVPANNRIGLEKICRYGMRGPFAQDRLKVTEDGRVLVGLQKPWPNEEGVTVLDFTGVEFLQRLTALIPPPFANLIRYHGLFAPRAKLRDLLPAAPVPEGGIRPEAEIRAAGTALLKAKMSPTEEKEPQNENEEISTSPPKRTRPKRKVLSWADLLRKIFAIEILICPKCGGAMELLAIITEAAVVGKILKHLGISTEPLPLAPARLPTQLAFFDDQEASPLDTYLSRRGRSLGSRAPPRDADGDWVVEIDEPMNSGDWGA